VWIAVGRFGAENRNDIYDSDGSGKRDKGHPGRSGGVGRWTS